VLKHGLSAPSGTGKALFPVPKLILQKAPPEIFQRIPACFRGIKNLPFEARILFNRRTAFRLKA